ncbi:magnesium transporter [Camelimonas fluminis]|uniref:Magnesium transporter CorA family protein n=1 Tax=Camelimonas fluminis TaxID=1576911 RepID=A0ABV7UD58_9HYPH|nr:magnesium transporter CorA family protein [Camelimonas fluminis]GHE47643.1 magnesium transporter [Camelimonas fluminis]
MIIVHRPATTPEGEGFLERRMLVPGELFPADAIWVDLIEPSRAEARLAEAHYGVSVPTREDTDYIEPSELLYNENGARYMTTQLLFNVAHDAQLASVSFILARNTLITVRYDEPKAFIMFAHRAGRPGSGGLTAEQVMAGLIETIIDRAAEVLQNIGEEINTLSRQVFETKHDPGKRNAEFQDIVQTLGHHGDLISKSRESLLSIERVMLFLTVAYRTARVPMELREQVRTNLRDLQSLEEHATFQSGKIQFLLDATLGLVNIEQNNIIKLFSVMAVVFMPPTLIASIYGMNFKAMPELDWKLGYPLALVGMVIAAIAPYFFFRWKKWL